jgi:superfamily II DNA or RNA helicase
MFKLRDYQLQAINLIENSNYKNVCLQMPTGAGKSATFCELAKRYHLETAKSVLILVHRQELLKQAFDSLGKKAFKIEKGIKTIPSDYDYYIGMVETAHRRIDKLPNVGLIIIDECHFGGFHKLPFFENKNIKVVGVTATPISNKKPLGEFYGELIQPTTISELIKRGYLLDCEAYGFASDLVSKANFKVKRGEFDEKQMDDFYSSEKMVKNVVEAYWSHSAGKKTIIFNVNVHHNFEVYQAFKKEGLNVYFIDSHSTDKNRIETIKNFKEQKDAIICNVGVLTLGFDDPQIQTVILNRATKSLSLYLQMIGRGSRLFDGKENFKVLDLGKNTVRHGQYDKEHDWQKYFKEGENKKDNGGGGIPPVKECPKCNSLIHARVTICQNCNHDFAEERERQIKEEKAQKLVLLTKENPIDIPLVDLFKMADDKGWNMYAVLHRIADHIVKYQNRYPSIVDNDYIEKLALENLQFWCRKYGKRMDEFNKKFIKDAINRKQNTV